VPTLSIWPAAPLARPAPTGPQRFDFLVRTRAVTPLEAARLVEAHKKETTYPQREAVLFALRELTGREGQASTEDWERWLVQHVLQAVP